MTAISTRGGVGPLVRQHRERARFSQLALALEVGVSARHLGFVELGRSRPSPELLMAIAERLAVPLRERNEWLLAAGHAPRYPHTELDEPALHQIRASLQAVLDGQDPYPAVAVDWRWNVALANRAAARLTEGLPAHVLGPRRNIFRIALHPDGFARRSDNFAESSPYLLRNLHLALSRGQDPALRELAAEVESWPGIPPRAGWSQVDPGPANQPVLTWRVRAGERNLALFTIMSTLGTPLDITLAELTIEMFVPADAATGAALRDWAAQS